MTPEKLKQQFLDRGETFSDWARDNGYPRDYVYGVLNGRIKARRGLGHEIAVKLGLKPAPERLAA
ncbi:MAG: DNA-binding protein [Rhodocyclaceae bacterium]|nr:DNA-binding protein [Rhodocyclaceae bacterium]